MRIVLDCNTSHLLLEDIYKLLPEAKSKVVNIIDVCVDELAKQKVTEVYLLASEGTILAGVYQGKLEKASIKYAISDGKKFSSLRRCIEAV